MRRVLWLSCATLLGLFACGGGATGPGDVVGTIGGMQVSVRSSAYAQLSAAGMTAIAMTSASTSMCDQATANQLVHGSQYFLLSAFNWDTTTLSSTPVSQPGTYVLTSGMPQSNGPYASVVFSVLDATCMPTTPSALGNSGTVTIDSISASSIQGTFDVVMSSGDHVTGSFDAASCPALDTWNGTTPATCM